MDNQNLTASGQKNSRLNSIIISAILIGIGAALRAFVPPFMGITPNFVIAMYCLAIILVRPNLSGALAIGLVSGIVSMLTSKSPIPYLNLITEPTGALVCFMLVKGLPNSKIFHYAIKPISGAFLGTIASGGFYVLLNKIILGWPMAQAISVFLGVVVTTAIANTVIAYVLYLPAQVVLKTEGISETQKA